MPSGRNWNINCLCCLRRRLLAGHHAVWMNRSLWIVHVLWCHWQISIRLPLRSIQWPRGRWRSNKLWHRSHWSSHSVHWCEDAFLIKPRTICTLCIFNRRSTTSNLLLALLHKRFPNTLVHTRDQLPQPQKNTAQNQSHVTLTFLLLQYRHAIAVLCRGRDTVIFR
jgi:hypothetical protein